MVVYSLNVNYTSVHFVLDMQSAVCFSLFDFSRF